MPSRKREILMLAIVRIVLRLLRNEFLKAKGTYFHIVWKGSMGLIPSELHQIILTGASGPLSSRGTTRWLPQEPRHIAADSSISFFCPLRPPLNTFGLNAKCCLRVQSSSQGASVEALDINVGLFRSDSVWIQHHDQPLADLFEFFMTVF